MARRTGGVGIAALALSAALAGALSGCVARPTPPPVTVTVTARPPVAATPTPSPPAGVPTPFSSVVIGDCLTDIAGSQQPEAGNVMVVPCSTAHTSEVYALPMLTGSGYPGDEAISASASDQCGSAFTGYVGVGYETSDLDYSFYTPDATAWSAGVRLVTCVVFYPQGETVGSVRGIGTTPPQLAG